MNTWIALFRGINVGGNNILPMADLRTLLEDLGAQAVRTYIQSGNAVFKHELEDRKVLGAAIRAGVRERHEFDPQVKLLRKDELETAIAENPYPEGDADPKSVHLWFLTEEADDPDIDALTALKADSERYTLRDWVFYLHAPDGIGRSKLAEKVERHLGVAATARNWRTVGKLLEMVSEMDG